MLTWQHERNQAELTIWSHEFFSNLFWHDFYENYTAMLQQRYEVKYWIWQRERCLCFFVVNRLLWTKSYHWLNKRETNRVCLRTWHRNVNILAEQSASYSSTIIIIKTTSTCSPAFCPLQNQKNKINYEFELSKNIRIHSIFHISLLKLIDFNTFIQENFHYHSKKNSKSKEF